ncbi:MAG: asparaginase [Actinomycetota bacterium]
MPASDNPIVAEARRGPGAESLHRGAWVLVDTDGRVLDSAGDPDQSVFARSSTKSIQAIPLITTGAADAFDVTDREIALAISSHNGEPVHAEVAAGLLARIGLDPDALRCGPQAPAGSARGTEGRSITHNCSGKHAGFLATAIHLGDDPRRYLEPESAVQREVRATMSALTGADQSIVDTAIDGCSAPTWILPLRSLATGLARVANPGDLPDDVAAAARRITAAAAAHPELVGGTSTRRFDTHALRASGGRLFAKGGAEAVQTVGVIDAGVGFAAKIDDGSTRALHALTLSVLDRHGLLADHEREALASWADPVRRNAAGIEIGRLEIVA